jgi:hypothetical protein
VVTGYSEAIGAAFQQVHKAMFGNVSPDAEVWLTVKRGPDLPSTGPSACSLHG